MGDVVLIRHGQTEWSAIGRHTSRTDLDLTPAGAEQAVSLKDRLTDRPFAAVLSSPRQRALQTAALLGLTVTEVTDDLAEWDYGTYEGLTSAEIRSEHPDWSLWTDGGPDGETPDQVTVRVDRLLAHVRPMLDTGDVALVGHGHALRVVAARWITWPASAGARLYLGTATLSELGFEHGLPVILRWNA